MPWWCAVKKLAGGPPRDFLRSGRALGCVPLERIRWPIGNRLGIGIVGLVCGPSGMPFALGCPMLLPNTCAQSETARGVVPTRGSERR